ncbi:unnamed protein product [Didymodactylos carnosus]|uniref:Uncharacterized protein n=1 Tax=Didymodactylos carnosus TaxID=1234261 RepID=A0A814M951_9BILA|nr:unnamed protein product [Didymodactylos carnosus]CAF3842817.1 unnamed protein product [Didymodactylos carnosus]
MTAYENSAFNGISNDTDRVEKSATLSGGAAVNKDQLATYERFLQFQRLINLYDTQSAVIPKKIGNPAPLGLCAFALTTFILSMYNAGATVPVTAHPGVVLGSAMFFGGLVQLLAGMWEFKAGNSFGALAFSAYGGFWLSVAALYVKAFGFLDDYNDDHVTINNALGVFFLGWTIFTFAMFIASHRTNGVLMALFFFLTLTFILLTASKFQNDHLNLKRAAGAFGILTSAIAWYGAFAALLTPDTSYFALPVYDLSKKAIISTIV